MLRLELTLQEIGEAIGCKTQLPGVVREICTDTRALTPGCLFVALVGERFDGHNYVAQALGQGAAWAIIHHKCDLGAAAPEQALQVEDTQQALIRIGGLYRSKFHIECIGITGSVGKTTTKDMVADVVAAGFVTLKTEGNQNNEIGMPKTLFRLEPSTQAAVIEMGMQGLGEIAALAHAARPTLGVITNIGVSHIEQLGSRKAILQAKLELAEALPDGAPLFLCGNNDLLQQVKIPRLDLRFYGVEDPATDALSDMAPLGTQVVLGARDIREQDGQTFFTLRDGTTIHQNVNIPCIGRHNVCNALAAFGVGRVLGMDSHECIRALERYSPSGMRQRIVPWKGMTIVEDCYNASPDSMRAALTTLGAYSNATKRIAVVGDMLELGKIGEEAHWDTGVFAAAHGTDMLLAYGFLAAGCAAGARQGGIPALTFTEKASLLAELRRQMIPGCVVWFKASHGMHLEQVLEALYEEVDY